MKKYLLWVVGAAFIASLVTVAHSPSSASTLLAVGVSLLLIGLLVEARRYE